MFFAQDGVAIRGFDTVAYFRNGAPKRGSPDIAVMWKAAYWHFSSHENREIFEANPRAFAPQFGGYCAYAVARGYLTDTDPDTWQIVEDKLYLVHSPEVARLWQEDIPGNIALAERNWPGVLFP
ncbi:YHS domain-containing (seleno)protein [Ruegeria aquimaris]|uniref:YHS domain protein n=1 Tax=Ruegeria aquimaris TaxID=2984333 RepID=A0ABT3AJK0_9RHOB|nr:YHS domain-containing (seleno)protein [Ruegeria sp. XHP0148]MCV2888854.1 YHS domain protein [Ruegeria sp. XHP0148]